MPLEHSLIINQHTKCILYKESKKESNGDKKEPAELTQSKTLGILCSV